MEKSKIFVLSNNNKYLKKMENLKNRLWDERGYDYQFMNSLTSKELVSLYDTEFYYED